MEQCSFYRQIPVEVNFVSHKNEAMVLVSIRYQGREYPVEKVLSDSTRWYKPDPKYVIREMKVLICGQEKMLYNCVEDFFWYTLKEICREEYYRTMGDTHIPKVMEMRKIWPEKAAAGNEK